MTSSLGGNHHGIDWLIGPGKAYDPARSLRRQAMTSPTIHVAIPSTQGRFAASSFDTADVKFVNGIVGSFITGKAVTPS